ncbi:MAG: 4Fe-4S binding protein [Candidatus Eisenbacteria bacterium]
MEKSAEPDAPKKTPASITIREDWCKGCEFCVSFCPKDVLQMQGVYPVAVRPEECTKCQLCVWVCPDFAMKVE